MRSMRWNSILSTSFLSCAMAVGLLASATNAGAQTPSKYLQVKIPFSFQAGSRQLPAGTYDVSIKQQMVLLQNVTGKQSQFLMAYPSLNGQARESGRLVFGHYGSHYFLHEIWDAQSRVGLACLRSSAKEEVLSARGQQPEGQFNRQPGGEIEIAAVAER